MDRNHNDFGHNLHDEEGLSAPLSTSPTRGASRSRSGSPTRPHSNGNQDQDRMVERIDATTKKKKRSCCSTLLRCLTKTLLQPCFLLQRTLAFCGDHPSKWGFLFGLLVLTDFLSSLLIGFVVSWKVSPPEAGVFIGVGVPIGLFFLMFWAIIKRFLIGARDPLSIWPSARFCTCFMGCIAAVFGFFFAFLILMNRGIEALQLAAETAPEVACGLTDAQNAELLLVSETTHKWVILNTTDFQVNAGSVRTYATEKALGGSTATPEWEAVCLAEMVKSGANCPDVHVLLTWVLTASALEGIANLQEAFDQNVCQGNYDENGQATMEKHTRADGTAIIRLVDEETNYVTSYHSHTHNSVERGVDSYVLSSNTTRADSAVVLPLDFAGSSLDELETQRNGVVLGMNALQGVHIVLWILSIPLLLLCKRCCRVRLLSDII